LADLTHLIGLGFVPFPLEVDEFPNALAPKHVVAAARSLFKSRPPQEVTNLVKTDICIRSSLQNPKSQFIILAHVA
jgi:hypothetical protein